MPLLELKSCQGTFRTSPHGPSQSTLFACQMAERSPGIHNKQCIDGTIDVLRSLLLLNSRLTHAEIHPACGALCQDCRGCLILPSSQPQHRSCAPTSVMTLPAVQPSPPATSTYRTRGLAGLVAQSNVKPTDSTRYTKAGHSLSDFSYAQVA